jgi:hypothetical protein
VASKSGIDASSIKDLEEALDGVDSTLDRLKTLYEQYFLGIQKQAPAYIHSDVERKLRDLTQLNVRNTGLRYRLATLQQKFGSYNSYWRRTLRQIENGTYIRNLAKIGREAARNGADIPEEILAAMPKRMREQVLRDRDQAIAIAKRRKQLEESVDERMAALDDESMDNMAEGDALPARAPHRDVKTRDGALVLDEDEGDMDFDAFFSAFEDDAPKPAKAQAGSPRLDTEPGFPPDMPQRGPTPTSHTNLPSRPTPAGLAHLTATQPAATQGPPSIPSPNRPTPSGAIPRPVVPSPAGIPRPVVPSPGAAIPRPVVPSPSGGIPRPAVPSPSGGIPRPLVPSPSGGVPTTRDPTGGVPIAGRQTGPVPVVGRQTGPVPTVGATPPSGSHPAVNRPTGAMPVVPPVPRPAPVPPSQAARPTPVAPGAAAKTGSVGVESMSGPFPRTPGQPAAPPQRPQTQPRPQPPASGLKPPPGMTEADVNALHAKYIQAKQMVGEKVDAGSREKLLKTINQTAPKIMEQYKASGVDFSVVVKDNKIVIKAKPKT